MKHHNQHSSNSETDPDLLSHAPIFAVASSAESSASTPQTEAAAKRLQVSTPADVLAYIECTLGFAPTDSLTVIAFAGDKMSTVVRCDLPEALPNMLRCDTPESVTFMDFGMTEKQELQFIHLGRQVGELMAREPSTSSCLLIYSADDVTVSDQHALAVMGTANAVISAQFGLQRVPVQESWLIHHNLLWHLRCAATTECVVQGDAIDDPRATRIFQALDPHGRVAKHRQSAPRRLLFPPTSTSGSHQTPDTQTLLAQRPQVVLNWLNLWDEQLREGPTMLHSDEVAELLSALKHPPIKDALLTSACFDVSTGIKGAVGLGKFPNQLATLAKVHGTMADAAIMTACLNGESDRAPDWRRIEQLERLCHQLLPLSDGASGGVIAGMLVWIEWVRGRGSIAMDYARQARKHFPTDQYLLAMEGLVGKGTVAVWATRMDSAWSPQHAA
jgi:hypothetical protein